MCLSHLIGREVDLYGVLEADESSDAERTDVQPVHAVGCALAVRVAPRTGIEAHRQDGKVVALLLRGGRREKQP